ncbi:MAG: succinate dehydrogenase/fumarate reductase iron-sulfur subunit [Candidatus Rokubacteria bacterium]|nr:succinate dehydrogenase/fumarate reductase iron-sulfur subunit [Candidatus Rokubacteria bacterium]
MQIRKPDPSFLVFRWEPGSAERTQQYRVEPRPGMTVLDALVEIQREQDPTLAFRYACRVGMCGSCAVVINGRERWACRTLLASLKADAVSVRPLYHFPLIRDLVVDMAPFAAKMKAVAAAFVPKGGEEAFAPIGRNAKERRQIDGAIECIGCGACLSACTMVGWDKGFAGPAALNRAFTLMGDTRDGAGADRWPLLLSEEALFRCHGQANCTEVCPMELSPTESILKLRRRSIFQLVKLPHRLDTPRATVLA